MSFLTNIIRPLSDTLHKGQMGRIGIVGGSQIYTGAPYFAGISALKVGCDLLHVFCYKEAASAIKSYSPELMVHPMLDSPDFLDYINQMLPTLHSLVIGPGLGRDRAISSTINNLIKLAKQREMPLVLDADALYHVAAKTHHLGYYKQAILTPNKAEFLRFYKEVSGYDADPDELQQAAYHLAGALGQVTIVVKGKEDIITNGEVITTCSEKGSSRRCGGQGDLLAGSLAAFNYWANSKKTVNWEEEKYPAGCTAALYACMLTKKCNDLAFKKFKRSTTTSDMVAEICNAYDILWPENECS